MGLTGSHRPLQASLDSEDSREVGAGAGPSQSFSRGLRGPGQPSRSKTTLLCLQESGLSKWLGDRLTPLESVPPPAIAFILCLLTAIFTECTSNVATTTLFLPILASMVSRPRRHTSSRGPFCPPHPGALPAGHSDLSAPALISEKGPLSFYPSPGSSATMGPKALWFLTHSIPGDITPGVS